MQLGAENRTKLIAAVALGIAAVALLAMKFTDIFGGGTPASATASLTRPSSPAAGVGTQVSNEPARPRTRAGARSVSTAGKKAPAPLSLDPTLRYDLLKASEDTKYEGTGRNIFKVFVDIPVPVRSPVNKKSATVASAPAPYVPPAPPPSNLKFYGFATNRPDGARRIFLYKNEDVFIAAEGDIVDHRYKVVHITANSVEILDVLSNNRENIPLTQG